MKKSFWLLIVLAILIVLFSVQNASPVEFNFLAWSGIISLAVLLIITFIAGVLVGAMYFAISRRAKKKDISKLNEEVQDVSLEDKEE